VGAAIVTDEGGVVLVRRTHEPLRGRWTLPGGVLELGETLQAGVAREVLEETGLKVEVGPIVHAVDHIVTDAKGKTEYHFVIADYLCRPCGGSLEARTDVDAVAVADPADLERYDLNDASRAVIHRALGLYTALRRHL